VAPHAKLFVAIALHTAARTGAILQLSWERVDLPTRRIDMGAARGKKRRARHLPINDALLPLLSEAREAATSKWVIEHGGGPVASVKTAFRSATQRADLPGVTPHMLRHTAVTWMVQAGVPMAMVAAYAAMSQQMVERVYGHHSPEWMQLAARALSGPTGTGNQNP
jgi:integrase